MKQKIKKFLKRNFFAAAFSSKALNQTDFGRIYFNLPKISLYPATTRELAETLRLYHHAGVPVTVRNAGHSVNGQTLTSGAQINIGNLKKFEFNPEAGEITVGAGATWDEVMKAVGLPKYCPPIFPNNPGQQIRVGGSASVGGIGFYASKRGGFWNHVKRLTLVSMTGEIIECSPEVNADYFRFALGGFGRIGVISELTMAVEPSKENLALLVSLYQSEEKYEQAIKIITHDPLYAGMIGAEQLMDVFSTGLHLTERYILTVCEVDSIQELPDIIAHTKKVLDPAMLLVGNSSKGSNPSDRLELSLSDHISYKPDLVYWYPTPAHSDQLELAHPWTDSIIHPKLALEFSRLAKDIIYKYKLSDYLVKHPVLTKFLDADILAMYSIKRIDPDASKNFPLSLDLDDNEDFSMAFGIMPNVPTHKLPDALAAAKELTELTYAMGGKRYLYGIHNLSRSQVEKQFGRHVIHDWQKIKDKLDPKHLLNIGVIEHLDS